MIIAQDVCRVEGRHTAGARCKKCYMFAAAAPHGQQGWPAVKNLLHLLKTFHVSAHESLVYIMMTVHRIATAA